MVAWYKLSPIGEICRRREYISNRISVLLLALTSSKDGKCGLGTPCRHSGGLRDRRGARSPGGSSHTFVGGRGGAPPYHLRAHQQPTSRRLLEILTTTSMRPLVTQPDSGKIGFAIGGLCLLALSYRLPSASAGSLAGVIEPLRRKRHDQESQEGKCLI